MKKLISVCVASSLLSLSLAAQAQSAGDGSASPEASPTPPTSLPMPHEPHPQEEGVFDQQGHAFFGDADTDGDGVLSVVEARAALPQLIAEDSDLDGILSQAEAEAVLPELQFAARGRPGGDAPITETEFGMIVTALNDRETDQVITPPEHSEPATGSGL